MSGKSQVNTDNSHRVLKWAYKRRVIKNARWQLKYNLYCLVWGVSIYRPSWWILCNFHAKSKSEIYDISQLSNSRNRKTSEKLALFCSESANSTHTACNTFWGKVIWTENKVNKQRVRPRACGKEKKKLFIIHEIMQCEMPLLLLAKSEIKSVQVSTFHFFYRVSSTSVTYDHSSYRINNYAWLECDRLLWLTADGSDLDRISTLN